jgi:ATP/maltotriose-dependent transcriptional regulator MalT
VGRSLAGEWHSLGAVAAKLSKPTAADAVVRADTIDAFAAGLRRRLTLVCAPAGYGKSTATASAFTRLAADCVWYRLDLLDRDPVLFLASLTEALRRRFPGFGDAIRERLRSASAEPFPLAHLQAMFVRECETYIESVVHVVLDDYHEAAESLATAAALEYLLTNLPAEVRFVLVSRYDPPLRISKLRLEGEVAVLTSRSLRFDVTQATEVLTARTGANVPSHLVRRLVEIAEGWPVSIVLAALALDWTDPRVVDAALSDPRLTHDIYSYLAEQVYALEDRATRRFLKRTCCLEHLTVPLAARVAQTRVARQRLEHLARNSVFTFDCAEKGTYRYHNLFRDFLRQKFVQDEGETAFHALHVETAVALEDAGEAEMAVELFLDANEPREALRIVAQGGATLLADLPSDRLASWADRLPPDLRASAPWPLLMVAELNCRESDFGRALTSIDEARRFFIESSDDNGLYECLSLRESALFWQGDTAAAIQTCQEALQHARTDGQRVHSLLSLASAAVEARDWGLADEAFVEVDGMKSTSDPRELLRARALRAHGLYYRGFVRRARELLPSALELRASPSLGIAAANTLGMIKTALADYVGALTCLEDALQEARRYGFAAGRDMVLDSMGLAVGSLGRLDEGLQLVRSAARGDPFDQQPALRAWARCHEATLLRRAGRLQEARLAAEEALAQTRGLDDSYAQLNFQANLLFTRGLLGEDVYRDLAEVGARAAAGQLSFVAGKSRLYLAILKQNGGQTLAAEAALAECLPRQLELGHLHLLSQELCPRPRSAISALATAARFGLSQSLMDAFARHPAFADLTEAICAGRPEYARLAVDSARRGADDITLARVLRITERVEAMDVTEAVAAARKARPPVLSTAALLLRRLTRRELEVLGLMADGLRNPEIARRLVLQETTVKTHVNHIFTKLEVSTRVAAVLAYREGQCST